MPVMDGITFYRELAARDPALAARAFLFFAYPAEISGNVWVAASAAAKKTAGGSSSHR